MGLDMLDIQFKFEKEFRLKLPMKELGPGAQATIARWAARQPLDFTAEELLEWFLLRVRESATVVLCRSCSRSLDPLLWCGTDRRQELPAAGTCCPWCGASLAYLSSPEAAWPDFVAILVDALAVDSHEVKPGAWAKRQLGLM